MTSNKVCHSFHGEGVNSNTATFIYESLFIIECKTVNFNPVSLFELLLLLTRNVEIFPGPTPREILDLDALLKVNGLHIFHQNVREFLSNKDYLVGLINSFKKVQVFALTETHVNKDLDYGTLFEIPGFDSMSKAKQNGSGRGGGVRMYMQNHLIWKSGSDLERDKIGGISVKIMSEKAKRFYIFVMYIPRICPNFYIQSLRWYVLRIN